MSRQPVREALQRLNTEGWVDLRPAQGAFVHEPAEEEADQLLSVRTLLEAEAARLAAAHSGRPGIEALEELCARGEQAVADAADLIGPEHRGGRRLRETQEFFRFTRLELAEMLDRWKQHRATLD